MTSPTITFGIDSKKTSHFTSIELVQLKTILLCLEV
jgi:hypothetical protein